MILRALSRHLGPDSRKAANTARLLGGLCVAALPAWIAGPASPACAAPPSFDCSRHLTSEIEELICGDEDLAALDVKLAEVYAQARRKSSGSRQSVLSADQSGWVEERNDCRKAEDRRLCTRNHYLHRIAGLQATYRLVRPNGPHTYFCNNDPANEVIVRFYATEPPTLIANKGERTSLMYLEPSASGAKYIGPNETFWSHGNEALIAWGYHASDMICQRRP